MAIHIGFSEIDITPPVGIRMAGLFQDRFAEKIHDNLFCRAMVLDNGDHPVIVLSCDLLSLRNDTVVKSKKNIEKIIGLPPQRIAVCASHNHSGPATSRVFGRTPSEVYIERLEKDISAAAVAAWEKREPARIGIGWGFEGGLSFNRRYLMRRTNQVVMNPPKGSDDILCPEGTIDPEIGILSAVAIDGRPLGCLINFACHVNVVGGDEISADFPGYFAAIMKESKGSQYIAIFTNGCSGNIGPINIFETERREKGHDWARHMGRKLAEDALGIMGKSTYAEKISLDSRQVHLQIPLRRIAGEAERIKEEKIGAADNNLVEQIYFQMVEELREEMRNSPTFPTTVQTIRIGNVGLVMVAGELFVELGLQIKKESPCQRTFVLAQANGVAGYIPTRKAFKNGGYEQRLGTNSFLAPCAGELIVDTGLALLDSMFG